MTLLRGKSLTSQHRSYFKDCKVASSGLKKTSIQRVIDHKAGLLRTRVVGEKRSREESGGVIEDGDVGAGGSVDQGRGSEEGDTAGGGGGHVGEDLEVWSDGCQYFDELRHAVYDELQPVLSIIRQRNRTRICSRICRGLHPQIAEAAVQHSATGSTTSASSLSSWMEATLESITRGSSPDATQSSPRRLAQHARKSTCTHSSKIMLVRQRSCVRLSSTLSVSTRPILPRTCCALWRVLLPEQVRLCAERRISFTLLLPEFLATAYSKDEKAPLLLGGCLRRVGYNARVVNPSLGDKQMSLICLNAELHDLFEGWRCGQ